MVEMLAQPGGEALQLVSSRTWRVLPRARGHPVDVTRRSGIPGEDVLVEVADMQSHDRREDALHGHAGFVDAHFHTADELDAEVTATGLRDVAVYGVEGPAWPALDSVGLQEFQARVEAALRCAHIVERDPLLINASAHLLAVGRK